MTEIDRPSGGPQNYFEAIEAVFVRLRGAPLLLSPTDWQIARDWYEAGIPLDLVHQTLEATFAQREERGARGRIQSLRYCADAVARAWSEAQELAAAGARRSAIAMDVKARLGGLVNSLPAGLVDREGWVGRVEGLSGTSEEIERSLAKLESELLVAAEESLEAQDRERLSARVERSIAGLRDRLPEAEIESARKRIWQGALRELTHLPLLSLFSSAALSGERDPSPQGLKEPNPTKV